MTFISGGKQTESLYYDESLNTIGNNEHEEEFDDENVDFPDGKLIISK